MMSHSLNCARRLCTQDLCHASQKVPSPDPFSTRSPACPGVRSLKAANASVERCPIKICRIVHHRHHKLTISYTLLLRGHRGWTGSRRQTHSPFLFCHRENLPCLLGSSLCAPCNQRSSAGVSRRIEHGRATRNRPWLKHDFHLTGMMGPPMDQGKANRRCLDTEHLD